MSANGSASPAVLKSQPNMATVVDLGEQRREQARHERRDDQADDQEVDQPEPEREEHDVPERAPRRLPRDRLTALELHDAEATALQRGDPAREPWHEAEDEQADDHDDRQHADADDDEQGDDAGEADEHGRQQVCERAPRPGRGQEPQRVAAERSPHRSIHPTSVGRLSGEVCAPGATSGVSPALPQLGRAGQRLGGPKSKPWIMTILSSPETPTQQTAAHAVTLDGITKTYKSKAGKVDALAGVTHSFPSSTFTAVMGAVRVGQVDAAAGGCRPRPSLQGQRADRWQRHRQAQRGRAAPSCAAARWASSSSPTTCCLR